MRKPAFLLLCALTFVLPWENSLPVEGVGTLTRIVGWVAAAFCGLALLEQRSIRRMTRAQVVAIGYGIWTYCTLLWTVDQESTLKVAGTYAQEVLLLLLVWEFATSDKHQRNLMQAFVLGAAVSAINTIFMYATGQTFMSDKWDQRYVARGFDPNDLGLTLAIAIPMAWYLAIQSKRRFTAFLWRAYVPVAMLGILLTASRGAFLASGAAIAIIPLTMSGVSFKRRVMAAFLAPLAILAIIVYVPDTSWARLSTTSTQFANRDFSSRSDIWRAGWDVFTGVPLTGVGAGAYPEAIGATTGIYRVAHNTFLGVLVETGLIGFAFYMTLLATVAMNIKRLPRLERRCWTTIMLTWGIGVCSLSWEFQKTSWLLMALLAVYAGRPSVRGRQPVPLPAAVGQQPALAGVSR